MPETLDELTEAIEKAEGWRHIVHGAESEFTVAQGNGRTQAVRLSVFEHEGEKLVRFTSTVGRREELNDPRYGKALEVNFRLPYGHLAIDGDYLVLTDTRPLRTTTAKTSGQVIRFIARQADSYEKSLFGKDVF